MRIMHLLTTSTFSGAENVCLNLMGIAKKDYDVFYVSLDGPIKEKVEEEGFTFIPLNSFDIKNLKKVINYIEPDIIHAHDIRASVYAAVACKIPIISHIHGKFDEMSKITTKSVLYRLASNRFKKILYVSKSIYNEFYFKSILKKKGILFENNIDSRKIKQRIDDLNNKANYDFVYVGRFEEVKNPLKFINVINKVQKINTSITCCMVGNGSLFQDCKEKIAEENIKVDLVGFKKEPLEYMVNAKALIMTSIREGLPMVALEAHACNIPIISTPTDGMVDLIKNGKNGYLCETEDEMVAACLTMMNEDNLKKMKMFLSNCDDKYINYSNKLLKIYKKVLD